ncbi:MAG: hypothetical protein ACLP5H_24030 [Desulfomonilaceae bacterium]
MPLAVAAHGFRHQYRKRGGYSRSGKKSALVAAFANRRQIGRHWRVQDCLTPNEHEKEKDYEQEALF